MERSEVSGWLAIVLDAMARAADCDGRGVSATQAISEQLERDGYRRLSDVDLIRLEEHPLVTRWRLSAGNEAWALTSEGAEALAVWRRKQRDLAETTVTPGLLSRPSALSG